MDGEPLPSRKFTFYHLDTRSSVTQLIDLNWKDGLTLKSPMVLKPGPLDWESSALTTRPLIHLCYKCFYVRYFIIESYFRFALLWKIQCIKNQLSTLRW